jgi:flagellin-like protein
MRSQNNVQGGGPATADSSERAVSPVVGVAILVGITVILASVVGAFVFGLVSIGESSPDASFTFSQTADNFSTDAGTAHEGADSDMKTVRVTHNSGEAIQTQQLIAKVSGNKSEPQSNESVYEIEYNGDTERDGWNLALNDSAGDRVVFKPGNSVRISMYGYSKRALSGNVINDYNLTDNDPPTGGIGIADDTDPTTNNPSPPHARKIGECDMIEIVWRSDSGAQGQVLQTYQVPGTRCA